nr:spastin-like [Dermacentor andersoni]XP_054925711.1 spastin-like [Dermacentor andersoni]XP_054925716.1 spastin-like [Dermacentor andersoni]XP_054925725.1 spastin-like [Dermacentor andersoni]XP_054925741.1 spastin-like [Dermacentor andersoni]XP_054925754.1 spastin-like [Dermacentor andersoni]XP_054925783.1 spastin-like [Dermacentor andersoni]XP_054925789.1 spastin-like [Dermacentor andersoni]XP_054925803.1 spastin-like [Dermacentor andersoni]
MNASPDKRNKLFFLHIDHVEDVSVRKFASDIYMLANAGPTWEWANTLKEKMMANLEIAKDRLEFLEDMVRIEHLSDEVPSHAGLARRPATPKRRQWQKVVTPKAAEPISDGPSWLKRAMNGVGMATQLLQHRQAT